MQSNPEADSSRQAHNDGMENDDEVLLANSDEEFPTGGDSSPERGIKLTSHPVEVSDGGAEDTSPGLSRAPENVVQSSSPS